MNLAGVHKLPVVFLCENNGYAISVPAAQQAAIERLDVRAAGYGFPGVNVDGCDAEAVHTATTTAVGRARAGGGPTLIDMSVPRIGPHSSQDDDSYRDAEQKEEAAARDPIPRLRATLVERGALDPEEDDGQPQDDRSRRPRCRRTGVRATRADRRPRPQAPLRRWLSAMAELRLIEAICEALHEEMARDDNVVLLGEDVGVKGGVFGASKGLLERFGPTRVLDTPVSEIAIAGVADRCRDDGTASGRRVPVRGLHASRLRPDREPGRDDPMAQRRAASVCRRCSARRSVAG